MRIQKIQKVTRSNPIAKDLRQPKYRCRVVPDKKKAKGERKVKHKGEIISRKFWYKNLKG